jgi:hypothetical protein
MFRLLAASVLIGSCCHAVADDTTPTNTVPRAVPPAIAPHVLANDTAPTNAVHYVAKINLLEVRHKQSTAMQTAVSGVEGTPLRLTLSGSMGRRLKLQLQDVPNSKPTQYVAEFQWVEIQKDGAVKVLFAPKLVTTVGVPALIRIGEEKGDRFEINLTVTEGVSVANKPKITTQNPTNRKQPTVCNPSSSGTLRMGFVTARIISVQEEE